MITSWSACHNAASSESCKSADFILHPQLLLIVTPSLGFSYFGTLWLQGDPGYEPNAPGYRATPVTGLDGVGYRLKPVTELNYITFQ